MANSYPILNDLRADGPYPAYAEPLMTFGQFVGTWDMDIRFFSETGDTIYHQPGVWSFAWALQGRVIQDVLVCPGSSGLQALDTDDRVGTSIRTYDPRLDRWRVTWFGATSGSFITLLGGTTADGIEIRGSEAPGVINRWTFTDISERSFTWTGWIKRGEGADFTLEQQMFATRRGI